MAVNVSHVYILLVFINNFISNAATERRFSDFKRCADEECSLLLCRGKASSDFTGPDCRFLSFKKGETVYVYYKLSGRRTDIWAGSVGNRFGYFHKDQLAINHIYTEKELEIPAQETDFVCFDTGHDKFDSYDIESLLVSSLLLTDQDKSVQGTTETLDRNKSAESTTVEVEEPPPEVTLLENDEIDSDVPEDIDKVLEEVLEEFPEDKDPGLFDPLESSLPQPETVIEALDAKGVESNTVVEPNTVVERTAERIKDDLQKYQLRTEDSVPDSVVEPEQGEAKESLSEPLSKDDPELENAPDGFSEGRPVPELKTILGTTFDAVTSDDEETRKVTPYDEEDEGSDEGSEEFEYQQDEKSDYHLRETPLLAFSEEHSNLEHKDILESEQTDEEESPPETAEKQDSKDLWSSLGDTVFNIVSGGERTAHVTGSEEEDDDEDDEGEIAPEEPPKIEEPKENIQLLANDPKQEPEVTEQPHEEPVVSNFLEEAVKMPDVESQTLLFEDEPEGHIEPSTPPADEVIPFEHTEEALAENLTVNESPVPKHVSQTEMLSDFDSNTSDSEQTQAVEELPIQKEPKENIQLLANDPKQEPEVTEQPHEVIFEEPIDSDFLEAVKMPDVDSQTLQLEDEPEGDIEPSIPLDDEVIPFEHTEEALAENLTVNESPVPKHVSQTELLSDFDSKTNVSEQKQAIELPIQKESRDFSQVENKLKRGGTELFRRLRGPNVPDPTKNTMVKERHEELPVDKEDLIDPENLEIEEELLEDENAALSFSSKTEYTDEDKESRLEFGSEQSNNATETEVVSSDELDVVQIEEAIDIEPEEHDIEDSESAGLDQTHTPSLEDKVPDLLSGQEPEYSDNVLRLTLLRSHFKEEDMARFQKILGLQNLFRVEFLFSDLEQELNAALMSQTNTSEDIEKVLEAILEASETPILDEIESMLDARENADVQQETELDEEATILDNFQELAFTLHQKYSTTSDSSPLAEDSQLHPDTDGDVSDAEEEQTFPHSVGDIKEDNLTVTETGEETKAPEEKPDHEGHNRPDLDMGLEEDVGHFNRNQDNQPEEIQRGPQAILENTLDMGLVDMEHPSSGSLESPPVSDFQEEEQSGSSFVSVLIFSGSLVTLVYEYLGIYAVMMVTCLPEEWKPGPDFYGVSWEPVLVTAGAGFIGFLFLFWRSVLSVKRKSYLTTEKEMADRMKTFEQEKEEILLKVAELQQQGEELKEKKRLSEKSATSSLEKILELKNLVQEMERQNECLDEEKNLLARSFDEERTKTAKHQDMMSEMDKTIEKLKRSRKKTQEALSKATILMEEAKLREDARNVQHQVLEKDIATLREENISLHHAANLWEEKHREMSEQIKVYQKSQKDLEDSLAQKDHNVEVLSDLLGDLEACDDLKGGVVANGEAANDKQTVIRNRIKQMMDVTRVQTTLSVVEEERDRFMTKLLNEEKARKELEEQYQKLEHDILLVKSDKNHLENQYKTLQQKNEIITEMYQQKENALQQKLTKEEFERRNNEDRLTEVDGKALEAEEEVKVCRQRIKEIQDELKQTEKSYKAQIIEQEQKSHENWVIARAAERALLDEKKESTNLRIKLTEMSSKLNELRRPLFKPTPGMAPMPLRRGDSYGPSPVSGGAPSPPLMMEGPGRPPSAPVGRRNEPYGPRPPSDPHGRYPPDHKHPVAARPDAIAPRTSSPSSLDSSQTAPPQSQAEAQASTENPEANSGPRGPGSLLVSPISSPPDSGPGPLSHPSGLCYRPPPGPGPHHIPPPPLFMPPMYRPANGPNGQPGMMPPGPPPPNGHPPGPMMPPGQRPPPPGAYGPSHHRGPPPPHYGPVPPPFGVRGGPPMARPMGPPRPYMHYAPRDHSIPPQHLPTGAAPYPPHGGPRDFPGQPPMQQAPHGHDSSVGPQGQDYSSQQAAATPQPQDSVSSSMAEP